MKRKKRRCSRELAEGFRDALHEQRLHVEAPMCLPCAVNYINSHVRALLGMVFMLFLFRRRNENVNDSTGVG